MSNHPSALVLGSDRLSDPLGTIHTSDLPEVMPRIPHRLHGATPFLARLARCALHGAEGNLLSGPEGTWYAAGGLGQGWNGNVFTRDICFSGVLGLNLAFPAELWRSLRHAVRQRLAHGLRCNAEHAIDGLPCQIEADPAPEAKARQRPHPLIRRTDDVLWLWCAGELAGRAAEPAPAWAWIAEQGRRCFTELYQHFFVPDIGLYRGQASFVDVGASGYPEAFGRRCKAAYNRTIAIMPASTNALYYRGLQVMAAACRACGEAAEAADWEQRARALRDAFRRELLRPDGTVAYYRDQDGSLSDRQHTLGTAFAIRLGLLAPEEAPAAVAAYPLEWWGVPLIHPFYPHDQAYHNHSAWPFSDAFLLQARAQALGEDVDGLLLAYCARSCRNGRVLAEWTDARSGLASGVSWQLWTLAPVLGTLIRRGVLEILADFPADGGWGLGD